VPLRIGQLQDGATARASDTRWATADLLGTEAAILHAANTGTRAGRAVVSSLLADRHAQAGLDREHLYVGMTRGRQSNHVHITTEPNE